MFFICHYFIDSYISSGVLLNQVGDHLRFTEDLKFTIGVGFRFFLNITNKSAFLLSI